MNWLAAIEGQVIFLIIAAIIGAINWFMKKPEDGKSDTAPSPKFPRPFQRTADTAENTSPSPQFPRSMTRTTDSEEERTRKFLEALGLPPDQAPKPIRRPERPHRPIAPPPLPAHRPRSLDEEPAPRRPVETLRLPELRTPEVPAIQTRALTASAISAERPFPAESDAYLTAPTERPDDELRALLRSPRDLRAAFLVREVLGPPRGLQSGFSAPTFAAS